MTKTVSENTRIAHAALKLAAAQGWNCVTVDAIAKCVKISLPAFKKKFVSIYDIVPVIAEEIDREAFARGKVSGTPHEILFDILMARFDVMHENRKAILSMADAVRADHRLSCILARTTLDGIYRVIDTAKLTQPPRPALACGVGLVYGWAFFAWRGDNSRDMAKTMAALDRALRLADKAQTFLKRRS
jgi:AcrR family transcriptional regulator